LKLLSAYKVISLERKTSAFNYLKEWSTERRKYLTTQMEVSKQISFISLLVLLLFIIYLFINLFISKFYLIDFIIIIFNFI
jgi:hypothetical protein